MILKEHLEGTNAILCELHVEAATLQYGDNLAYLAEIIIRHENPTTEHMSILPSVDTVEV